MKSWVPYGFLFIGSILIAVGTVCTLLAGAIPAGKIPLLMIVLLIVGTIAIAVPSRYIVATLAALNALCFMSGMSAFCENPSATLVAGLLAFLAAAIIYLATAIAIKSDFANL